MSTSHHVIDTDTLRSAAAEAVAALKLLANEDRLILLCQLSQGEMCVSELEEQLGITVDDDDIDGDTFASVGALADFVAAKLAS